METLDLDMGSNSFEIHSSMSGGGNNFEPFSNEDGAGDNPNKTDSTKKKFEFDAQKTADTVGSVGSAVGSIVGTVQAFQDPSKAGVRQVRKEEKRNLKDVCGAKPLIRKKEKEKYELCRKSFYENKNFKPMADSGASNSGASSDNSSSQGSGMSTNTKILLGVGATALISVVLYFVYKSKKVNVQA